MPVSIIMNAQTVRLCSNPRLAIVVYFVHTVRRSALPCSSSEVVARSWDYSNPMYIYRMILALCLASLTYILKGQEISQEYSGLISKADSAYNKGDFKTSVRYFTAAFKSSGWKGQPGDRYNAACSWALSGTADSAFHHLEFLAAKKSLKSYGHVTIDTDLNSLHGDKRWITFLEKVKQNKERAEANLDKPLARRLDSIYVEDQKYRMMIEDVEKKHGFKSKEMQDLWKIIMKKDSGNLIAVTYILDTYGWLGEDKVGEQGRSTLFLVI